MNAKKKKPGARSKLPRIQKVNRDYYLAIPKAVRDQLRWNVGDWVAIDVGLGATMVVKKVEVKKI